MKNYLATLLAVSGFCLSVGFGQNCTLTVDAGADQTVCNPGETVILNATPSEEVFEVNWSPAGLFTAPTSLSTTAAIPATTTLEVRVRSFSGQNLIVNGNFDDGDTGFESEYNYGAGGLNGLLSSEGTYAIATNASNTHNQFAACLDHTGGGNMMVVNGAGSPTNVWCQTINIDPNTDYAFSAWVTTVVLQSPAQLQFSINNQLLGDIFVAPFALCEWLQFYELWNSGNATTAEICLANQNTTSVGNDFALDDLVFTPVCEATDQLTVTLAELDTSWDIPGSVCANGDTVILNDWLSPQATPGGEWTLDGTPLTVLNPGAYGPGDYTLRYTAFQDDCSLFTEQTLTIQPIPVSDFSVSATTTCAGEPVIVTYTGTALPGAGFDWNFGGGNANPGNGIGPHTVTWPDAGSYNLELTVTENGCISPLFFQPVEVVAPPAIPVIDCQVTLSAITFSWPAADGLSYMVDVTDGPPGVMTTDTSYNIKDLAPGQSVTIELTLTPQSDCPPVTTTATCETNLCPTLDFSWSGDTQVCAGEVAEFLFLAEGESEGPFDLTFTLGDEIFTVESVASGGIVAVTPSASGLLTVLSITDPSFPNCTLELPAPLFIETTTPVADAGPDQNLGCAVELVTLGGTATSSGPDYAYEWIALDAPPLLETSQPLIEVDQPGTYVLTVTQLSTGCTARDTVLVDQNVAPLKAFASFISPSCFGEADGSIRVDSVDGGVLPYLYALDGGPFDEKPSFENLPAGNYTLAVVDANGCAEEMAIELVEPPAIEAMLIATAPDNPPTIRIGETVGLELLINTGDTEIDTLIWEPEIPGCESCLRTDVQPASSTTYTVTVRDVNGCETVASLRILVDNQIRFFAPNAFSPNNDGINDRFVLFAGEEVSRILSLTILDRWGNIVFEGSDFMPNDPAHGWDGRRKGQNLGAGVYAFYAKLELGDGTTEIRSGDVTLLR